jgi:hypothetical protein
MRAPYVVRQQGAAESGQAVAACAGESIYKATMSPDDLEKPPTPEEEARDRRAANIFLLVAGALLVGVGVWLANAMIDARRADDCMSSGRRNCNPIETPR